MTEYTDTQIAQRIIDDGLGKNFITIALGMLKDPCCDLDGRVSKYANDMAALKRRAVHELEENE